MNAVEGASAVVALLGAALCLLAAIGLHRFSDLFARMHAATKPSTLGLALVMLAAAVDADDIDDVSKLVLVVALQFLTAPVGAHMVGRAAYRAGQLGPRTVLDELADTPALAAEGPDRRPSP